mmetsp:Transcript_15463/g.48799  ORF Transcript_15463/g.48799 Transcript_15463/m.48799 type:complete len:238 (-) Transcript_15463:1243-1956(-)
MRCVGAVDERRRPRSLLDPWDSCVRCQEELGGELLHDAGLELYSAQRPEQAEPHGRGDGVAHAAVSKGREGRRPRQAQPGSGQAEDGRCMAAERPWQRHGRLGRGLPVGQCTGHRGALLERRAAGHGVAREVRVQLCVQRLPALQGGRGAGLRAHGLVRGSRKGPVQPVAGPGGREDEGAHRGHCMGALLGVAQAAKDAKLMGRLDAGRVREAAAGKRRVRELHQRHLLRHGERGAV